MIEPLHPATLEDIHRVCAAMRPADRAECLAATGLPPEVILPLSEGRCLAMVAPSTGEVVGLCGVEDCSIPGFGRIWMCATTAISRHRFEFIRHASRWIEMLHDKYPRIGNMVDARNKLHIRWLSLLGFRFTGLALVGSQGLPFITFERTRT